MAQYISRPNVLSIAFQLFSINNLFYCYLRLMQILSHLDICARLSIALVLYLYTYSIYVRLIFWYKYQFRTSILIYKIWSYIDDQFYMYIKRNGVCL